MKKRYSRSRSPQYHRSRKERSHSRSRDRKRKSHTQNIDFMKIKKQSDIKNHFIFKIKPLTQKEQQETLAVIRQKLTEQVGPVQSISRTRERGDKYTTLRLGFKYDIDALSYLSGGLTIKTSSESIVLNPEPTQAFELLMDKKWRKRSEQRSEKKKKRRHHQSSDSFSSESPKRKQSSESSQRKRKQSVSKNVKDEIKLHLFGVPASASEYKIFLMFNKIAGGPYQCIEPRWKKITGSACEYFQFYMNYEKGKNLLRQAEKLEIDQRPVLLMQAVPENKLQLLKYQIKINFPHPVHPYLLLKKLKVRVVQMLAADKPQVDGRCRSFFITLSDLQQVYHLKRTGRLDSGISVEEPRETMLVYRPVGQWILPPRSKLI